MGTLAQAIAAEQVQRRPCKTCDLYDSLEPADREDLAAAMDDDSVSSQALSRALKTLGYSVSGDVLRRHRNGECERWNQRG